MQTRELYFYCLYSKSFQFTGNFPGSLLSLLKIFVSKLCAICLKK